MYIVGEEEIEALARVIRSGALFRYGKESECDRFEERYAHYLGCKHFALAASGSNALAAAMTAAMSATSTAWNARPTYNLPDEAPSAFRTAKSRVRSSAVT